MNTDGIRCRYTREECEEPALYKVGKCDLCFVAEEARGDIPRVDRSSPADRRSPAEPREACRASSGERGAREDINR